MRLFAFPLILAVFGCEDETISGYADPSATYVLEELAGVPFEARATIRFPKKGLVEADAPCNSFSAKQDAPYPWLTLGPIAATKRACLELEAEIEFLGALQTMGFAEVSGPVLILSSDDGVEMVFRADVSEQP